MASYTMELPDVPQPRFDGDGWVRVGEYVFDIDEVNETLDGEAEYIACCLAAQKFVAVHNPRRQRIEALSEIAKTAAHNNMGNRSVFDAIAEAVLDAMDKGRL